MATNGIYTIIIGETGSGKKPTNELCDHITLYRRNTHFRSLPSDELVLMNLIESFSHYVIHFFSMENFKEWEFLKTSQNRVGKI